METRRSKRFSDTDTFVVGGFYDSLFFVSGMFAWYSAADQLHL